MPRYFGGLCLMFGLLNMLLAQSRLLSPEAQISLMTCAPGAELYSAFGHSAVRVYDRVAGIDTIYNYGTFDFDPPGFYAKFARGQLNYRLDKEPYDYFQRVYQYLGRGYAEQVFNLDSAQRQDLYIFLEENYRPTNRYYLYDFFYDNCATRITDGLKTVLGDSLQLHKPDELSEMTFRECIDGYLGNLSWADFGIDLALGSIIDQRMTFRQKTFHPDYLAAELAQAQLIRNGQAIPLIASQQQIYEAPSPQVPTPWLLRPIFLFSLAFVLLLAYTLLTWKRKQIRFPVDGVFFLIVGIAGLILFLLWFATEHSTTKANFNLLWLMPIHLFFAPLLFKAYPPKWLTIWFLISSGLTIMCLIGWPLLPQSFHIAFLPLMLSILLRSGALYVKLSRR